MPSVIQASNVCVLHNLVVAKKQTNEGRREGRRLSKSAGRSVHAHLVGASAGRYAKVGGGCSSSYGRGVPFKRSFSRVYANSDSGSEPAEKAQLADRPPALTREEVIERIKQEAPFLVTREVLARKFTYDKPVNYDIGDSPAGYILYMLHLKSALPKELLKFKQEVTRTFQPDPTTVIVRWKMEWEQDDEPAIASGSTTYILNSDGLVTKATDRWTIEGDIGNQKFFAKSFEFANAWRPFGLRKLGRVSLPIATRYAAWETLKDDPNYGGQLTREEMDVVTDQVMLSVLGLGISIGVLLMVIGGNLIRS